MPIFSRAALADSPIPTDGRKEVRREEVVHRKPKKTSSPRGPILSTLRRSKTLFETSQTLEIRAPWIVYLGRRSFGHSITLVIRESVCEAL